MTNSMVLTHSSDILICIMLLYFLSFPQGKKGGNIRAIVLWFFEDEGAPCTPNNIYVSESLKTKLLNDIIKKMQASVQDWTFATFPFSSIFWNRWTGVCAPILPTKIPPLERSCSPLSAMVHMYRVHSAFSRSKNQRNVFGRLHSVPPILLRTIRGYECGLTLFP